MGTNKAIGKEIWKQVKREYLSNKYKSVKALAEAHDIKTCTVRTRIDRYDWNKEKKEIEQFKHIKDVEAILKEVDPCMKYSNQKAWNLIKDYLDNGDFKEKIEAIRLTLAYTQSKAPSEIKDVTDSKAPKNSVELYNQSLKIVGDNDEKRTG